MTVECSTFKSKHLFKNTTPRKIMPQGFLFLHKGNIEISNAVWYQIVIFLFLNQTNIESVAGTELM